MKRGTTKTVLLICSCSASPTIAIKVPGRGVWCAGVTVTTVSSQTMTVPSLSQPQPNSAPGPVSQPLLGELLLGDQWVEEGKGAGSKGGKYFHIQFKILQHMYRIISVWVMTVYCMVLKSCNHKTQFLPPLSPSLPPSLPVLQCSKGCGGGYRSRTVVCHIPRTGVVIPDSRCSSTMPPRYESCRNTCKYYFI